MNQTTLEFKERLVKKLEEAAGTEARISFVPREDNNGLKEQVLVLGRKGCRYTVSFRLTGFYEGYCENKDFLDSAAAAILKQFEKAVQIGEINRDMLDYASVKDRIGIRLINAAANRERLSEIPHFDYLDMSAVFYIKSENILDKEAFMEINKDLLDIWGRNVMEIFEAAIQNLMKEPASLRPMNEVIEEVLWEGIAAGDLGLMGTLLSSGADLEKNETGMYVLSNEKGIYGACEILNISVLQKFAAETGKSLYLIPSSVHEIIILPEMNDMEPDEVEQMVWKVNQEEVEPQDRLSNSVYLFDKDTQAVWIAKEGKPL